VIAVLGAKAREDADRLRALRDFLARSRRGRATPATKH
jgi:hypothetical protein